MEGADTDNTAHNTYSDNVSFNSSLSSVYSAEEQIIKQRGRKSPKKRVYDEQYQLQQQQLPYTSTRDLFSMLQASFHSPNAKSVNSQKQRSPNNKTIQYDLDTTDDSGRSGVISGSPQDSCRRSSGKNLGKSLLRTPVKRRLKLRRDSRTSIKKLKRHF